MKTALTIAGSDCSGGAGVQADIKTMMANGVYGMSAITSLTAQNTLGVKSIFDVTAEFLADQLDAIFTDIFPDAVKIGMISSPALAEVIAEKLIFYKAKNIVLDPVMVATSGATLTKTQAVRVMAQKLLPISSVVTPNIPEAEVLSKMEIKDENDMKKAAQTISACYGCNVLLKGGHSINDANDLLYSGGEFQWFSGRRIDNPNTHGTGCTFSSAIASNLAKGLPLPNAISEAKEYISAALSCLLDLGKGRGPLNHGANLLL